MTVNNITYIKIFGFICLLEAGFTLFANVHLKLALRNTTCGPKY
jgi:hypothetical protein